MDLHCSGCGETWEIAAGEAEPLVRALETGRGFRVDMSHVTIVGRCEGCAEG